MGENVLSDQDVARFVEWYETGMAYGDEEVQVELPTFGPEGSLLESLDFVADFPAYTPPVRCGGVSMVCGAHQF